MKLRTALLGCSSGQLARIAAAWTLTVEAGTLRRELVDSLGERIVSAAGEASTWTTLGETALAIVRLLVRAGGRHESDLLARRLGGRLPDGADGGDGSPRVEEAVAGLVNRGLLFRVFDADEQRRGVYLLLPDELLEAARHHLGDGADAGTPSSSLPPSRVARSDLAADLFLLASALRREAWGAASRGLARRPAHSVGQILGRLRGLPAEGPGDPGRRWRFLLWVAQRAGWIGREPLPLPHDEAVERLLANRAGLPASALAAGPVVTDERPAARTDRVDSRRRQADALQLLSELDPVSWWSVAELAPWLASQIADRASSDGDGHRRADRRLEEQLTRWLTGRWFWLGLVAWGACPDAAGGAAWTLVAPTEALRALATGQRSAAPSEPVPCVLSEDLGLSAPMGADLAILYRAERYFAFAGHDGEARRYRLTPASFDRGIRLGGDADELRALVERLSRQSLPSAWATTIERWSQRSSRLTVTARLVLTAEQPATLAEALAVPAARQAAREELSPRHVLVAGEDLAEMLAELARAGLPVEVDPGLRAEPVDFARSAALAGGVAESAWVALEVLRRLAPEVVAEQRDLQAARRQLDAVFAAGLLEALGRRAATIVAAIASRRRPRARRGTA